MSRSLPSRPNLDHLRKQAKDLLDTARSTHPDWQLADAQFALARDYGFPSWPALKAHVDKQTAGPITADAARAPAVPQVDDDTPMTGIWIANVGASTRHPAFEFRSATLDIRVRGTRVTLTQAVVDATGKPSGSTMTIDADGEPHRPDGGSPTHVLVAGWLDALTLEAVDSKDGTEAGRGRYEVSPDGRTLVVTTADQRLVFDRQ